LTFYTEAKNKDVFLGSNVAINVANTAMLLWDNSDDLTKAPTYTYNTTGQGTGIGGGGLLKKTSPSEQFIHNPAGNTIKWTIQVNSHEITMPNAVIVDTIPSGQELLIDNSGHAFIASSSGEVNQTITSNADDGVFVSGGDYAFTLDLGNIAKKHTITYYTKITDFDALYKNGNIQYNNGVKLTYTGGGVEETGNKEFSSQMLNKGIPTGGGYNYNTHLMKWEIVVNRNKLPLANAKITDTLPDGMVLEIDATHKFEVSPDIGVTRSAVHEGTDFFVTLPVATSEEYTITFWTRLTDVALKEQWSGTKPFKNTAVLSQDGKGDVTHSATANIRNPFVQKSHKYTKGDDTIHWTVEVNRAQVAITNGEVVDLLNAALQLDPDSVKLFEATVQANATDPLIKGAEVTKNASAATDTEFSTTISKVGDQDQLSVYLPTPTKKAYILEFDTIIVEDSIDLQNTVSISGSGGGADSTYSSGSVVVNNLYSSGGSGSNTLTVIKKDSAGNLLKDAEFRLTNAGKLPITSGGKDITKETDGNGEAKFESLPSWTFYVEETEPSPGYLIPSDPYAYGVKLSGDQIVMVINAKALADVAFTKKGAKGELLSGGKFTLAGTNYEGTSITIADVAANASGIVSFANLELGTYTITETEAPAGHLLDSTPINVVVEYNATKTAVVVKLNGTVVTDASTEFINTPNTIDVQFTKQGVDENGNTIDLSGGKFTLAGTDYNLNSVTQADRVADANGIVTFTGIQIGTYTITETEAPAGYLLPAAPAKIFDVEVEYNVGKTGLIADLTRSHDSTKTNIYVDKKGLADISFAKVDSRDGVTPLSGGLFELSGTDYKGDPYVQTAPSIGGTVTFTDVPIDDGSIGYTIKELSSPSGYKLTTDTLAASVRYPVVGGVTDYTKVEGKITSAATKLENDKSKKVVPKTGMLMISKKVTGNAGDKSKKFTFTVTFSDKVQSFEYVGDLGNGTIKSGDKIQLAHGESITIVEIPDGVTYKIVEDDYTDDGYKHGAINSSGTIKEDIMAVATFTNDKHDEDIEEEGVLGDTDEKDPDKPGKPGDEDGGVLGDDARLPKTGDDFMPAVWVAGLIASLLGIWYVLRRRSSFGEE
jgi:LPXTG-motif cell wall-anchored protein